MSLASMPLLKAELEALLMKMDLLCNVETFAEWPMIGLHDSAANQLD